MSLASVSMKQRWGVQNHIKTVHAIAVCNLVEMSMGLVAESTIPSHLRWLPMGMDVAYKKKATGQLTATSTIDANTFFTLEKYPGMVKVPVIVTNAEGVEVTTAEVIIVIYLRITSYSDYITPLSVYSGAIVDFGEASTEVVPQLGAFRCTIHHYIFGTS